MDILASVIPVPTAPTPAVRPIVIADTSAAPAPLWVTPTPAVKATAEPINSDVAAPAPTRDQVDKAVAILNKAVQKLASGIEFSIDSDANDRLVVKIVDQSTKEVIRQMPTKEALEISKAIDRSQGLLLRQEG